MYKETHILEHVILIKQAPNVRDEVIVRDIFWAYSHSIKLLNTFPTVLIIDSTYKTNKYKLPLLEMVGATSVEKTYSIEFAFLESEKEENVTYTLEVAKVKEKIVCAWTDQVRHIGNTTTNRVEFAHAKLKNWLGNSLNYIFHEAKRADNVGSNRVKCGYTILKTYGLLCVRFIAKKTSFDRSITVLEHKFKDNNVYAQLVGNISPAGLNYIFHEAKRADNVGSNTVKHGYTILKTYGLPYVRFIAKKVKLGNPLRIIEVCSHWKRLRFDDGGVMKDGKSKITILIKWEVIQELLLKVNDNMKLHIKEQLRKIAYSETTDLKPPSQPVKIKGVLKKVKPTSSDNSTVQSPSYFEHVDKFFSDSPTPKSQKSVFKGARINKPHLSPLYQNSIH
ncbi:uncharacterized protein LOC127094048 [Lathyrus oleraceus]|uniref:uncharacterized protein LOC127094048 n=1 Tax=Pisum sativum TaxID=3888 RepID=UPI0021CEB21A|nr:uncharacterized protein LOC127094048 [Pisum sativum]